MRSCRQRKDDANLVYMIFSPPSLRFALRYLHIVRPLASFRLQDSLGRVYPFPGSLLAPAFSVSLQ